MKKTLFLFLIILSTQILSANNQHPIFVFSHGLGGNKKQAYRYYKEQMIGRPLMTFDFPDVLPHSYNPKEVNLGQEQDVATLKQAVDQAEKPVVLFGVSRGAATIINFLAQYPNTQVAAVILESPFDHVQSVVTAQYYISALHGLMPFLFGKYNPNGLQPIKSVPAIPAHIPILIICAQTDSLVPCSSSEKLYYALKNSGHEVEILKLTKGAHANLLWGPEGDIYEQIVHKFYARHGILL